MLHQTTFGKIINRFVFIFVLFVTAPIAVSAQEFLSNEVIVKLNQSSYLAGVAAQYGLSPTPLEQFGSSSIYRLRVLNNANISQVINNLRADSTRVSYADPNYIVGSPSASNVSWSLGGSWSIGGSTKGTAIQWMRKTINLDAAHVTVSPLICSGEAYSGVIAPRSVIVVLSSKSSTPRSFEMPKSSNFDSPFSITRIFEGFKSR